MFKTSLLLVWSRFISSSYVEIYINDIEVKLMIVGSYDELALVLVRFR